MPDKDERLAWMIIFATIPVGLTGLALERVFRTLLAKPGAAAVLLLFVNGLILLAAEALRRSAALRRHRARPVGGPPPTSPGRSGRTSGSPGSPTRTPSLSGPRRSSRCWQASAAPVSPWPAGCGSAWTTRTPPGSRFLLATPVILAAGVLKVPSLAGPAGAHIHGQVAVGYIVCGIAAYISVRLLVRWFQTKTLTPFAVYCLACGLLSALRFI